MTTNEKILQLCNEKHIAISRLERELTFSNGSLKTFNNISAERLNKVAHYFNVPLTSLLDDEELFWDPYTQEVNVFTSTDEGMDFVIDVMRSNPNAKNLIMEYAKKVNDLLKE